MPKSTRCGACGTPIKGHARRNTDKATRVTAKVNNNKRKNKPVKEQR